MSRPTTPARFTLDSAFGVGAVHPRLYGSFVEHLGRCVYTGIYEPGHTTADADGLRQDVLELVRELGVTTVRYPGGNFVSGYRWEDSVGPREERPTRLDLAWKSTETNEFGLGEFMDFCAKTGMEPMMAVNLGTRGVEDAVRLLEYCNHPGGTELSDRRITDGGKEPYGIKMWCLGNEMDGPWQIGHKTAEEYGRLAAETARAMKMIHPDLELVACGSSGSGMDTFAAWEATVLEAAYDLVDHISLHAYYEEIDGDRDSFLASAVDMEHFIESVVATCDHVRARLKATKRINLSFDEWNVWYQKRPNPHQVEDWQQAPRLLEDVYTVTDAVVFGSLLIALLRHADRVTAASLAQLVNVIAPIMTEPGGPAWRQTTFFPFAQAATYGRGRVLRVEADSPTYTTAKFGEVPLLHATAVTDDETGAVTVFAVNRGQSTALPLEIDLRGVEAHTVAEHLVLADADPEARNTLDHQDRVAPHPANGTTVTDGVLRAELEPMSWNMIRLVRG
ncbi:arabinosylfuranosidase ArfA [Streptomyces ipomoeae]|uniref:non-reducing end alpha-L-arabinofuranosidase n=2 Tax=Streptomyces ipomoeae TaxID=103232 RepID=L1KY02_9ACTN|nr:alpha-N-arabinofuranosidase [Streptomyces ipomoeae]EKX65228.1 alpha-L-arabinofuranosidase C-terminal domain protein [Streptomyces ipomoeae 91-03]MDX2845725.1 alpha-N-arabinofuranosidase [Streptomyces ipomoeae]MDX2877193.1 alpha-N-arabinofuranosidase [Streptomyces ipomoeae]TQE20930.1 alpha-N-arabinofuranosidase [Streptomyces ipomoeae]